MYYCALEISKTQKLKHTCFCIQKIFQKNLPRNLALSLQCIVLYACRRIKILKKIKMLIFIIIST